MAVGPGLVAGCFALVLCWYVKGTVAVPGVGPYPLSVALDTLGVTT